jgi:hypothetical protein
MPRQKKSTSKKKEEIVVTGETGVTLQTESYLGEEDSVSEYTVEVVTAPDGTDARIVNPVNAPVVNKDNQDRRTLSLCVANYMEVELQNKGAVLSDRQKEIFRLYCFTHDLNPLFGDCYMILRKRTDEGWDMAVCINYRKFVEEMWEWENFIGHSFTFLERKADLPLTKVPGAIEITIKYKSKYDGETFSFKYELWANEVQELFTYIDRSGAVKVKNSWLKTPRITLVKIATKLAWTSLWSSKYSNCYMPEEINQGMFVDPNGAHSWDYQGAFVWDTTSGPPSRPSSKKTQTSPPVPPSPPTPSPTPTQASTKGRERKSRAGSEETPTEKLNLFTRRLGVKPVYHPDQIKFSEDQFNKIWQLGKSHCMSATEKKQVFGRLSGSYKMEKGYKEGDDWGVESASNVIAYMSEKIKQLKSVEKELIGLDLLKPQEAPYFTHEILANLDDTKPEGSPDNFLTEREKFVDRVKNANDVTVYNDLVDTLDAFFKQDEIVKEMAKDDVIPDFMS